MLANTRLYSDHCVNKLTSKTPDSDAWQQILACDAKFCNIRPILKDNTNLKQMYLRRRMELSKERSIDRNFVTEITRDSCSSRCKYGSIRERLLISLYGYPFPDCLPSLQNFEHFRVHSIDESSIHCSSLTFSSTDVSHSKLAAKPSQSSTNEPKAPATLDENYAFCGIQHIFDHHSAAVNRLRFAHSDNTRLAMASADGTISICRTWPPEDPMHVVHILSGGHSGSAAITDIVWSLSNDFIVSTAMDGSVCVWDMEKAALARVYPATSIGVGPVLACLFQPLNFNLLVVGGAWGSIQTLNLSTGKASPKGRDQIHSTRFSRNYQLNNTSQVTCRGQGCVTALEFEDGTGTCLWVGTDRGIIQSYTVHPGSGHLVRAKRHNLGLALPSHVWSHSPSVSSGLENKQGTYLQSFCKISTFNDMLRRKLSHPTRTSDLPSHTPTLPCITSLSMHSRLSKDRRDSFLLVRVAHFGLLLFRIIPKSITRLTLERTIPILDEPETGISQHLTMSENLRLMHSCFAPLLSSNRYGACAMTGGLDGNVYVYNVIAKTGSDYSRPVTSTPSGLLTTLQGHSAPVLDVAIGWDENVLASADEVGVVITWRRRATCESA